MTLLATNAQISAPRRARSRALTRFLSNRGAVAGACVIALILTMAILAPLITRYDPNTTNFLAIRKPPSLAYWLGTDELGRDLFARMLYGARASLMAGVISVSIAIAIGLPIGLVAGYYGGLVDMVISRCTEALLACPFLILAIALAAFLGPSLANAMVAIGLAAMPIFVRLTRGQVISVKAEDYVEGARAIGLPHHVILIRHVLPNVIAPVIVQATLATASAIIAEASLSFLGLGQQPPSPSWGSMLNTAKNFIEQAPWMSLWPGLAIFLVVLAFNLMGDGLRDALDPRRS
ncbi:MAG: ABC transporter permease [Hyphomicrobiales bacterium]|nr:ABC transporter permease [Hyphomicrobiales bacterium]OQW82370.1 MAG: diguanylate cyclase [Proteobacteria bacterium ST_bin15]